MTLPEVVAKVLQVRQPLRQTELVAAMLEAGYQSTMSPKNLRTAVGIVLRKGAYRQSGGKWAAGSGGFYFANPIHMPYRNIAFGSSRPQVWEQ